MNKQLSKWIDYFFFALIDTFLVLYFMLSHSQDLALFILSISTLIFVIVKKISYKKLLIVSATFIGAACIWKVTNKLVLASEFISLAYISFFLSLCQVFFNKLLAMYGKGSVFYNYYNEKE